MEPSRLTFYKSDRIGASGKRNEEGSRGRGREVQEAGAGIRRMNFSAISGRTRGGNGISAKRGTKKGKKEKKRSRALTERRRRRRRGKLSVWRKRKKKRRTKVLEAISSVETFKHILESIDAAAVSHWIRWHIILE